MVQENIEVLVKPGTSAIRPLKAIGMLNIPPIINPLIDQWYMRKALMPSAKPIRVRLVIICKAIGAASSPGLCEASPKQTRPKKKPDSVAMMTLFVDIFLPPCIIFFVVRYDSRVLGKINKFEGKGGNSFY